MAIKKSELYSSLWAGADSLRGGMDASEYKNYVLNLLFLKYISDKAKNNSFSEIEVPQGCFYEDILALEGDKEIGDKLNKIIAKIAKRNDLEGVIDSVDFNDNTKLGEGKAMIDTLSNLVKIFADLSLGAHEALDDDLLGDAYEYLMRHFASESGKSKGQFYTPSEVSLLLSLLLGIDENTRQDKSIYDPTCGSGSLLLKASSSVCSKVLYEFEKVEILDKYGVYQLFKDYYNEVLQDDWFLLSFNGFISAKELRKLTPLKDKNKKANYLEEPDFVIQKTHYKSDLIPKNLIKQRFFEQEAKELEQLENALNEKEAHFEEFIEEHSNEEGLFYELKINESVLKKELKNATDSEDKKILKTALELLEAKNKALKMKNKAYEELELKAFHQYKNLKLDEIKDLIIQDKWLNSLKNALENKILKRINAFANALNSIISNYSNSLLELDKEVKESESKVLEHLKDLGLMG